jgi:putative membrane protein
LGATLSIGLMASATSLAAPELSKGEWAFVAKVSQGGIFEVEASKLAEEKAQAQNVKDLADTEVQDHQLVGDKLKSIASADGMDFPAQLNADFQKPGDSLNGLSGEAFDKAICRK